MMSPLRPVVYQKAQRLWGMNFIGWGQAPPKTVTGGPASPWPGVSRLARLAGGAFRRGRDETPKSTNEASSPNPSPQSPNPTIPQSVNPTISQSNNPPIRQSSIAQVRDNILQNVLFPYPSDSAGQDGRARRHGASCCSIHTGSRRLSRTRQTFTMFPSMR